MGEELVHINPFLASVPILYPLKTLGNQKSSGVFRKYKMRVMAQNSLIKFIMQRDENLFIKFHCHQVASGGRVEEGVRVNKKGVQKKPPRFL